MASSESTTTTLLERVQGFVSENKRAVLIGTAAAIAVGGVAYYASTSSRPARGESDIEKGKKKKTSKGGKKKKTVNDADGPLLEEREPLVKKVEEVEGMCFIHGPFGIMD